MTMTPRYKVLFSHYSLVGGVRTLDQTYNITEVIRLEEDEGIETTLDEFNFVISIQNLGFTPLEDDLVKIYLGDSEEELKLVMDGFVTEIVSDISMDTYTYRIKGMNRLERLLRMQWPANYDTDTNAGAAIINLIGVANDHKMEHDVNIETGSITATPNLPQAYWASYKPIFQHIEILSTHEYTTKGDYVFWLAPNNYFIWESMETNSSYSTSQGQISEGEEGIYSFKATRKVFDVINAAIIMAGLDKNDNTITVLVTDPTSMGLYGPKWKYFIDKDIADSYKRSLTEAEYAALSNQDFREEVRNRAKAAYKIVIRRMGSPRYQLDIDVRGNLNYIKGRIYTIRSSSLGWNPVYMRLKDIQHTFNERGWRTLLRLAEDDKTILL